MSKVGHFPALSAQEVLQPSTPTTPSTPTDGGAEVPDIQGTPSSGGASPDLQLWLSQELRLHREASDRNFARLFGLVEALTQELEKVTPVTAASPHVFVPRDWPLPLHGGDKVDQPQWDGISSPHRSAGACTGVWSPMSSPKSARQVEIASSLAPSDDALRVAASHLNLEKLSRLPTFGSSVKRCTPEKRSALAWFMQTPLDVLACLLILANTVIIFVQLQFEGCNVRAALGMESDPCWPGAESVFSGLDYAFATIFLLELVARVAYFRAAFFKDPLNLLDAAVIAMTSFATFAFLHGSRNMIVTRMMRNAKFVRTLRFARAFQVCHQLRVLVRTISASFMSLFWSMIILFFFMLVSALFLCQSLQEFVRDASQDEEDRRWVESTYGSAAKALWTFFQITFSGGWPAWVHPLVEKVGVHYAMFFAVYVAVVVFAVLRIITALFLKDTLNVAANDKEMMIQNKLREKAGYAARLEQVFREADRSGDGKVTWEEFEELLSKPSARAYLSALELETHEVESMFMLLDDGDGSISSEEFLSGIVRLKGQARSLDVLLLLHENKKIAAHVDRLTNDILPAMERKLVAGERVERVYTMRCH